MLHASLERRLAAAILFATLADGVAIAKHHITQLCVGPFYVSFVHLVQHRCGRLLVISWAWLLVESAKLLLNSLVKRPKHLSAASPVDHRSAAG